MRAEQKWKGRVREAVISNMIIAGHTANALPKLGLAPVLALQTMSIVTHTHHNLQTIPICFSCYNPTPTRISNNGFSPRYMNSCRKFGLRGNRRPAVDLA